MRQLAGNVRLPVTAALATVAASVSLGPTFLRASWFFPAVFAVVVVAVGCEVTRRVVTTRAAVPLGGAAALTAYLLLRYAGDQAWWNVVPTVASLDRLGQLVANGRQDVAQYAAPIGVSPGIEMLTVGGVGLVALLVDTLAVTARRAALAGLPLLVLLMVPTSVAPDGVSWLAFAIGATGFLALLLAESRERVSRWGRPMASTGRRDYVPQVETAPLGQVGRRVGATALGLALVVPAVLPDLDAGSFGFGGGGLGSGGGAGTKVAVVNPIIDLGKDLRRPENRPVITYAGRPTYLRLVGLDEFTGELWRPSELEVSRDDNNVEDGLATAPGLSSDVRTATRRYDVQVLDLKQTWLPLPYPTKRVSEIEGTWLYDRETFNVFGENASTLDLSYSARAVEVQATAEQLRSAADAPESLARYLELPDDLPPTIEVRARDVVEGTRNDYERALRLQDWLRDPREFTYSTEVSRTIGDGNGSATILNFLDGRQGYCVHFASTMAVMARLLDIPARVAVGFTQGQDDGSGRQVVGLHDAHSWPELYFQGAGWVRFEPTPSVRTGAPPEYAQSDAAVNPDGSTPTPSASPTPGQAGPISPRNRERTDIPDFLGADAGGQGGIGAGPVRLPVVPTLITLGMLLTLAVPALVRLVVRRRRWSRAATAAARARAAWAELQDTLVDHGYDWRASDSPRAGMARLARDRSLPPESVEAGERLVAATESARYAPVMSEPGDLHADIDTLRSGLADASGRVWRWRARLLPRSTRAVATTLGERTADALDALDAGAAAVSSRLRLRRT